MASSTTCSGEWPLPDDAVEPLRGRRFLLSGVFIGVLALGLGVVWAFGGTTETAGAGGSAPDFTVELLDEGSFSLADHIDGDGRPLVLNLWASWCLPCREEIPTLSAYAEANPGVAVIGVAVEDRLEDSLALAKELKPSYPLAFGDSAFRDAYPSIGLPVTYFIDADGKVTDIFNGVLTAQILTRMTRS